jgi:hypothetical protein
VSGSLSELAGLNLYIKGRIIANGAPSSCVLKRLLPIFQEITQLNKKVCSPMLYGYSHILLSTAYYLAGGYLDASAKHRFYKHSIRVAEKAMSSPHFPPHPVSLSY